MDFILVMNSKMPTICANKSKNAIRPRGYNVSCSTQLSMDFILVMNFKMPTICANKSKNANNCWHLNIYMQLK